MTAADGDSLLPDIATRRQLAEAKRDVFRSTAYAHYLEIEALRVQNPGAEADQLRERDQMIAELSVKLENAQKAAARMQQVINDLAEP